MQNSTDWIILNFTWDAKYISFLMFLLMESQLRKAWLAFSFLVVRCQRPFSLPTKCCGILKQWRAYSDQLGIDIETRAIYALLSDIARNWTKGQINQSRVDTEGFVRVQLILPISSLEILRREVKNLMGYYISGWLVAKRTLWPWVKNRF